MLVLRTAWRLIRLPALAFLILLEPPLRLLLCSLALGGFVVALVLRFAAHLPRFPFWGSLAVSIGCVLLLGLHHQLIRLLSR